MLKLLEQEKNYRDFNVTVIRTENKLVCVFFNVEPVNGKPFTQDISL